MSSSGRFVCVEEFQDEARSKLDRNSWSYYSSGATTEHTLKDNIDAYSRYVIRPRVLADVSNTDLRTTILGQQVEFPICVSPTAMQCLAHPEGEKATARACTRMGTCMTLSSWSTTCLEDVAEESGNNLRWFQLYIYTNQDLTYSLVKRAEKSGYKALAVTLDTPELGNRYADVRNSFSLPPHLSLANFITGTAHSSLSNNSTGSALHHYTKNLIDPSLTWESIDWLRSITSLPIVLKGILRAEDAREALCHDVQGIIVSNHGARQLDGVPATIDVLSEIVQEVGGKIEVFIDGGIRHGTDVLKALSLGARAVFVGRPILWGLACKGEEGAYEVLSLLKEELRHAMVLSGCANITDVHTSSNLVVHKTYYTYHKAKL